MGAGVSALDNFNVAIEQDTGNVVPILHEIEHALNRLVDTGETTVIDLMSMPLAPGESERLDQILGEGEVRVEMEALGPSVIRESQYPGVWIVTHRNAENELMSRLIEITRMPGILMAQDADVLAGIAALKERFVTVAC